MVQDHMASTQVHMPVENTARIVLEIPQIECVKLESPPTPAKIAQFRKILKEEERDVSVMCGLGALYGMFELEAGADGFMTGFAFPEILKAIVSAHNSRDSEKAWSLYKRFLPLIVFEQQPGVGVRKELYRMRGLLECPHVRHPAPGVTPMAASMLRSVIEDSFGGPKAFDITRPLTQGDLAALIDIRNVSL